MVSMACMKQIRVGIIGSGGMAGVRAEHFEAFDDSVVAAVAARNTETGRALAERYRATLYPDWRDVTAHDQLDAVCITTHNALHGEIALEALARGKAVFSEYPACRRPGEAASLMRWIERDDCPVVTYTHREPLSRVHAALRARASRLGRPIAAHFSRVTPGRGKRPQILFNLAQSGPPALFFVYHVHPVLDLFGVWDRVVSTAAYSELRDDDGYERFINTLSVSFGNGALGDWYWAGGVTVPQAEESLRFIFENGSMKRTAQNWESHPASTPDEPIDEISNLEQAVSRRFVDFALDPAQGRWRPSARQAIEAAAIGIAAEISQQEHRAVERSEILGR